MAPILDGGVPLRAQGFKDSALICASIRPERRSPPSALGRAWPCSRSRLRHRLMPAALTPNRSAAARCDRPRDTAARTRTRKSIDKAFDIAAASARRKPMKQTRTDLHRKKRSSQIGFRSSGKATQLVPPPPPTVRLPSSVTTVPAVSRQAHRSAARRGHSHRHAE